MTANRRFGSGGRLAGEKTVLLDRSPVAVPLNLGEWVAPRTLAAWVSQAVERRAKTDSSLTTSVGPGGKLTAKSIVAVLLYAYSTQLFTNQEIIGACHADPVLQDLCGDKPPFPHELEHCRRRFRPVLEGVLGEILSRAIAEHFDRNWNELPAGVRRSVLSRAKDRLNIARQMDTKFE